MSSMKFSWEIWAIRRRRSCHWQSLAMQVGSWKPFGRQSICYILLPLSLDNEEYIGIIIYIKYDHWATALHSNQAPSSGVASRRVSIRAPQRNPEDPDHTKHVPTISYCVVPKLCKIPTFSLSESMPASLTFATERSGLKSSEGSNTSKQLASAHKRLAIWGLELHRKMNLQGSPGVTRRHQVTKSHQVKTSRTTMTNRQQLLHQPRGFDFTSSIGIILKFAGDRRRPFPSKFLL